MESLLINTLASDNCFSYRNIFQNGIDALFLFLFFVTRFKISGSLEYPIMFKFCYQVAQTLITELHMTFQTFNVSFCNGSKILPIRISIFHIKFCVQAIPKQGQFHIIWTYFRSIIIKVFHIKQLVNNQDLSKNFSRAKLLYFTDKMLKNKILRWVQTTDASNEWNTIELP